MKNKDKYDLRELYIAVFSAFGFERQLMIKYEDSLLYSVDFPINESYKIIVIYNEWLESEVEENVD